MMGIAPAAGDLDRLATVLTPGQKQNPDGSMVDCWNGTRSVWLNLQSVAPRQLEIAKGFAPTVNYVATLRHNRSITNECKLQIGEDEYEIDGVIHDPSQQRAWTQLYLTAVVK